MSSLQKEINELASGPKTTNTPKLLKSYRRRFSYRRGRLHKLTSEGELYAKSDVPPDESTDGDQDENPNDDMTDAVIGGVQSDQALLSVDMPTARNVPLSRTPSTGAEMEEGENTRRKVKRQHGRIPEAPTLRQLLRHKQEAVILEFPQPCADQSEVLAIGTLEGDRRDSSEEDSGSEGCDII
ncbi:uncharacterized protein N7482_003204 [Penicillium canariense]|uniref:Uncharacterized protein n=1 Tax=Penicillium canariense TaxID=189055 RepID=A0A9W9I441_9EURO|nr:uncharacterized protein N7482_003204 [Penicillium canariense]KAJ5167610.1 hypothetical protein N7482_003204 [Penicillium canariense]